MSTILYWLAFGLVCVAWALWVFAVLFGGGPLGYTRNSTEATPTDRKGQH
jgi:hypothetical protein